MEWCARNINNKFMFINLENLSHIYFQNYFDDDNNEKYSAIACDISGQEVTLCYDCSTEEECAKLVEEILK